MVLCVNVRTKIKDLVIEYIEVILKNGEFVNINWDYSEIERTHKGFTSFYDHVWDEFAIGNVDDVVKYHIKSLRKKLTISNAEYIKNV